MKTSKLLITIILMALFTSHTHTNYEYVSKKENEDFQKELLSLSYESTIRFIKQHEGFSATIYKCSAGYSTIGYGHVIKPDESFASSISKRQADKLLREDFNKALKLVDKKTTLKGRKKMAIAHFVFSVGIGKYLRSTLRKKIDKGAPIDDEILSWSRYKNSKGILIRSNVAYRLRIWELQMYNSDMENTKHIS